MTGYRLIQDDRPSQPAIEGNALKAFTQINANEDAIVESAMADIDAEYEALCAEYALTSV